LYVYNNVINKSKFTEITKRDQEVDQVLIHKTPTQIFNDTSDVDDADADSDTAIQQSAVPTTLSKKVVPFANTALSKDALPNNTAPSTDSTDAADATLPMKDIQNSTLMTSSNNFTPIFAAFFQVMTSSILSTTTGSTANLANVSPIKNDTTNNITPNNVSILSKLNFKF
jgi:hypothetical protein